jgi:DNA-binding Lrp family transcriptional regulator
LDLRNSPGRAFLFKGATEMTVKQIADLFGVSRDTVLRAIKEIFPDKIIPGKRTLLNKQECISVGEKIRKPGYIQPTQNATQNAYVTKDDLKAFAKEIVSETIKQIMPIINQAKQLEEKIEYFTLRGWEIRKDLRLRSDFENSVLGRLAKKISEEMGKPRPIIDDTKYGRLRTYHVSVLEKLFEDSEEEGI